MKRGLVRRRKRERKTDNRAEWKEGGRPKRKRFSDEVYVQVQIE